MNNIKYAIRGFGMALMFLFLMPQKMVAQEQAVDSVYLEEIERLIAQAEVAQAMDKYSDQLMREEMRFEYADLIPLVKGFISVYSRHDFIYNHPAVFEKKNLRYQDYAVAGAPLAAAWIMKAAGVKSRSTTRRMLTSNAFAIALAAGLTEGTKHIVKEPRPDKSDSHSFPSGHATLAYVGATVLSREFGHVSPWITVGAYSAATATELLRIRHNAHWLNDIYMGAGIGVVSTNLGYWLADRIYGEDGINRPGMTQHDVVRMLKMTGAPSSVALVASTDMGRSTIEASSLSLSDEALMLGDDDLNVHISSFTTAGVEASWYVNPYVALEALAQSSVAQGKVYSSSDKVFTGNSLQMYRGSLALKGSLPLPGTASRIALRAMGGVRNISSADFYLNGSENDYEPLRECRISVPRETKFEMGCGLCYDILATKSHVVGFNVDYYHAFSRVVPNRFQLGTVWRVLF